MKRKIALKRLSSSDLTLFEHHYRNTSGAKQKAINLDSAIFIDSLFPTLPDQVDVFRDRFIVTLSIYGPGFAGVHSITRKILKQQKNWRLNGELISNPPDEPNRYDPIEKGDYAIIEFTGEHEPHTARMYLIAKSLPQDMDLHAAIEAKYGISFSPHRGMLDIDPDELAQILSGLGLPEGHPALDFIDFDTLEDAAQGGFEGLKKLRKRRQTRGVSREELARARLSAERVGRLGEEILNAWFEAEYQSGNGPEFIWDSDNNAVAPYDFTQITNGEPTRRVDAKSTYGDFTNPIHVSFAELKEMVDGGLPYDIYRLYTVNEFTARLRIANNLYEFASNVLSKLDALPKGITVDGISINPDYLTFDSEIKIDLSDYEGNVNGDYFYD